MKEEPKQIKCYCGHTTYCDCSPLKKHDGYIVPFDMPSESLKKGDILRHKNGLDDDMFENIVILNSSYCLPPEWVETWEKYYHEEIKQTAVNYLIHSINEDMFQLSKSEAEWKEIFEQAKQMEKEQMADKWQEGYDACEFHNDYENLQTKPINNPYK